MHLKLEDLAFFPKELENPLFSCGLVTCQEDKTRMTKSNLFEDAPHTVFSALSIYCKVLYYMVYEVR